MWDDIGPRLAPLADVTVCVCDFKNFGFLGDGFKSFLWNDIYLLM